MPVTRAFTAEEDITMSLSTMIGGLVGKYSNTTGAKPLIGSIVANTCLLANQLIESTNMTFTEKARFRGELKELCERAFRPKLNIVGADGEEIPEVPPFTDNPGMK